MHEVRFLPTLAEGFRLYRRAPLAIVVWSLITIVISVIPYAYLLLAGAPAKLTDDAVEAWASSLDTISPLMNLVQIVGGILLAAFVGAALLRSMLRPEDRSFFYLKFSRDEFHIGVVFVVLYILALVYFFVVVVALMLAVFAPFGISIFAAGEPSDAGAVIGILFAILLTLLGMLFAMIPVIRMGFALPMTFAEGQIRIFEAWRFTRGYTWKLFGLFLVQLLLFTLLYMVVAIVALVGVGVAAFSQLETLEQDPASITAVFRSFMGFGILLTVLGAFFMPIIYAPWVKAYQLIAGERQQDSLEVFD